MTGEAALHSWNREAMDRPTAPSTQGRGSFYRGLAIGGVSAALATALIVSRFAGSDAPASQPATLPATPPAVDEPPPQTTPSGDPAASYVEEDGYEIQPKRLADAFEAATGHRSAFSTHSKWHSITTEPVRIVELPFGPVLLTRDTNEDTHASVGAIGVHYLEEENGRFRATGSWPRAVEGWDWGDPPEWHLTNKFTANPAIYAWGDFMGQGIITRSATLVELTPDGPVESDLISTGFDDEGHVESNPCKIRGRIANIRKDRSFDVIVSGSRSAVEHYEKKSGRFVAKHKVDWEAPCGYPPSPR